MFVGRFVVVLVALAGSVTNTVCDISDPSAAVGTWLRVYLFSVGGTVGRQDSYGRGGNNAVVYRQIVAVLATTTMLSVSEQCPMTRSRAAFALV